MLKLNLENKNTGTPHFYGHFIRQQFLPLKEMSLFNTVTVNQEFHCKPDVIDNSITLRVESFPDNCKKKNSRIVGYLIY